MKNHSQRSNTNEYQFCTENNVITTALSQFLSNSIDENRVSIVSPPKNVKFVIPVARSGIASNESTYNVVDSTTRTITHVKDIFPLNLFSQSQIMNNENENEITKNESEEIPLLPIKNSNEQTE